jgi:hypothetical protein
VKDIGLIPDWVLRGRLVDNPAINVNLSNGTKIVFIKFEYDGKIVPCITCNNAHLYVIFRDDFPRLGAVSSPRVVGTIDNFLEDYVVNLGSFRELIRSAVLHFLKECSFSIDEAMAQICDIEWSNIKE